MSEKLCIIPKVIEKSAKEYADITAVRWLVKKEICGHTYARLDSDRKKVWNGLCRRGLAGVHAAIIGASSYPWIVSYLGLVSGNAVAVPLDAMLPAEELFDLFNRSDSRVLFVDKKLAGMIPEMRKACKKLELAVILDEELTNEPGHDVISFGDLVNDASDEEVLKEFLPKEDDVCTFIYTSGTTGKSKGVMLTQKNIYDNMDNIVITAEPGMVMLSVLPIHHAYCLVMDWLMGFSKGATLAINDSLMHMVRNISRFQPQIMLMVPLMVETVCKKLAAIDASVPKPEAGRSVFGSNLRTIYSGGAHLDPMYIDAMAEYGVQVCEGYGMSECSPVISTNGELGNRPGSVGLPLANIEVKFEEGELLVRGSSVMKGYYQMPKETAEALKDGWLHTGDLGHMDEDGFLYITGRAKNLIIMSNGENISPEEVEQALAPDPLVAEIIVTGENNGLTARIYPDYEYAGSKGLDNDKIRESLQEQIDAYNKKQPAYRAITALVVRKFPFLKSSTKKIKRPLADIDEPGS